MSHEAYLEVQLYYAVSFYLYYAYYDYDDYDSRDSLLGLLYAQEKKIYIIQSHMMMESHCPRSRKLTL